MPTFHSEELSLGLKQELFVTLEQHWVMWVLAIPGFRLRHGEGRILQEGPDNRGRRSLLPSIGVIYVKDLVHKEGSSHYNGIGADWNLFVNDKYISNGSDLEWEKIGKYWKTLHPLARWGGDWGDANHISLEHNGVK
jgi:hypothetical protein